MHDYLIELYIILNSVARMQFVRIEYLSISCKINISLEWEFVNTKIEKFINLFVNP